MNNLKKSDVSLSSLFNSEYYDNNYFASDEGKTFNKNDGTLGKWGYRNPEGEWHGCGPIVAAWKQIFNPEAVLDVGCGRGTFIAYLRDYDINAHGFDFSNWAIGHLYPRCKSEWVRVLDATKKWDMYGDKTFDLSIVLDLMEHLYSDDIDSVIDELYRVTRKYVFLQIATVGGMLRPVDENSCYILKKNENVPVELEGCVIAGHVTMQTAEYWRSKLSRDGWIFRDDIVNNFIKITPKNVIRNWLCNTIIVMERVE